jgi:hypothetical protein
MDRNTHSDHASRPPAVAECSLKPEQCGALPCYRFQVRQDLVAKTAFRFVRPDLNAPAIDTYEIIVNEFVDKK